MMRKWSQIQTSSVQYRVSNLATKLQQVVAYSFSWSVELLKTCANEQLFTTLHFRHALFMSKWRNSRQVDAKKHLYLVLYFSLFTPNVAQNLLSASGDKLKTTNSQNLNGKALDGIVWNPISRQKQARHVEPTKHWQTINWKHYLRIWTRMWVPLNCERFEK
jgi:hypothetical protein